MNDLLLQDLQELVKKYPELKNQKVIFEETDIKLIADEAPGCLKEVINPEVLVGHSSKVEVRRSTVHGYGVFAKEDIEAGELIEQTKLLKLGLRAQYLTDPVLKDYVWGNKKCNCSECQNHGTFQYLALGLGSLYNHSDNSNTFQKLDFKTEVMTISARDTIKKDMEIFVNYGNKYFLIRKFWKNIKENNQLEKVLNSQVK